MLWVVAFIFLTLFLYLTVTSFRNFGSSLEGVYEKTKDQVSRDE